MKASYLSLHQRIFLSLLLLSFFFVTLVGCDKVVSDDVLPSNTKDLQLVGARLESVINQKLSLKNMLGNDVISQNAVVRLGKPANGFVVANGDSSGYTYVPKANFVGIDSIPYQICQGRNCDSSIVVVVIKDSVDNSCKLQAQPDFITVANDSSTQYPVYINDVACGRFIIRLDGAPTHGTAFIDQQSRVVYTPTQGYLGADKVAYSICKGTDCSSSWVNISVTARQDTATNYCTLQYAKADSVVARFAQSDTLRQEFTIDVFQNDVICNNSCTNLRIVITTPPAIGSAVVAANGRAILYTAPANAESVSTQLRYKVCATCSNQQECVDAPVYIRLE